MERLNPGATYIYERVGDTVFAREFGDNDRIVIGRDFNSGDSALNQRIATDYIEEKIEDKLWQDIRRAAKTNTALQGALDRVKIIYHLGKDNDSKEN